VAGDAGAVPFVGLTGGMGAGKSEALAALERLGAATLSTDAVVHELLTGPALGTLIAERFGDEAAPGGTVDRDTLAAVVFEQPAEREWLEGVLWPLVGQRVIEWRAGVTALAPPPPAAVVEVPLLFESGMDAAFDHTIAVVADDEVRAERMAARGHRGTEGRDARQLTQDEKAARASFAVRNEGTIDELEEKLRRLLDRIRA